MNQVGFVHWAAKGGAFEKKKKGISTVPWGALVDLFIGLQVFGGTCSLTGLDRILMLRHEVLVIGQHTQTHTKKIRHAFGLNSQQKDEI